MAEEGMTTTTTTTTTTQRTEVVTIGCNIGFLRTVIGILMVVELIVGLICWSLVVSYGTPAGAVGFAAFATIASWIVLLTLFLILLIGLHGTVCANLPWGLIQVIVNGVSALFVFIAACILAAWGRGNWAAASAFAFIWTVLYLVSFVFTFRKAYGRFPWQGVGASAGP